MNPDPLHAIQEITKEEQIKDKALSALCRRAVLSLMLIATFAELGFATVNISAMPVFLRTIKRENFNGYSTEVISLIFATFLLSEAILKSPMGHLSDRIGRKRFLVLGPTICIFTALITALIPIFHINVTLMAICFVVLRIFDGVGAAMIWPTAFAMLGEIVSETKRASALSLLNTTYMVGLALGPFIGGSINDIFQNKSASFYVASCLFAITAGVGALALPDAKILKSIRVHRGESEHPIEHEEFHIKEFVQVARTVPFYLLLSFITFLGIGMPMPIIKLFALEEYNLSETAFAALLMPPAITMAFLSLPLGRLADKWGRIRSVKIGIGAGAFAMWVVTWAITVVHSKLIVVIMAIVIGLGFLIALPAWLAAVSEIDNRRRGAYLGTVLTAQGMGAIVGAITGGFAYQHIGHYAPFLGCAIAVSISFGLSFIIMNTAPKMVQP